ncbi:hypothetical protein [Psychrobacter sp. GP33]|uniref:hypothetical protein n=1 Tax=Psychrobacter sp. GP33 TaxID=2758709 RepID=UPI0015FC5469|nr:hypothetical protein [Psychrobacter sp. GP33]
MTHMIINKIKQTQKITPVCIVSMLASSLLLISSAHAAPKVIVTPNAASSTIIEQTSDGQVATITTTPTGISMQSGMPYSVTQVTNVPRYTIRQNGVLQSNTNQVVVSQSNVMNTGTTVTTLPLNTIPVTNQVTSVGVVTTPVNIVTQTLPVTTLPVTTLPITTLPITNNNAVAVTTTTSLDTLQLKPVFSTPNVVAANTKVMKILKNREGREFAVPANHIAPGDIIEYHTVYTNTTARPVSDINATVTLPNGIKLLSLNSTLPTLATVGGNNYQTIGQVGMSTVIQQPYSGLKWNLVDLGANAAQTVVIRATVQ